MFSFCKEAKMFIALFCAMFTVTRSHLHRVAISDPVTLECKGELEGDSYWKYGDEVLYFNRLKMSDQFGDSFNLLENYSLFISSALLSHQGSYECIHKSVGIATHILEVQVPPEVFITVGGHNTADVLQIDENEEVNATCHALHASPVVNLTWKLNDHFVESSLILHMSFTNDEHNLTWDTLAFLKTFLHGERGNITCISSPQETFTSKEVYLEYFQYATPTLTLKINQHIVQKHGIVDVAANETMLTTCYATEARPAAILTWLVNGNQTYGDTKITVKSTKGSFTSVSNLLLTSKEDAGLVTCIGRLNRTNITTSINGRFKAYAPPEVFLTVNGHNTDKPLTLPQGKEIVANCRVIEGRPAVNLTWLINNADAETSNMPVSFTKAREKSNATTLGSELTFSPATMSGNLTCVVNDGLHGKRLFHASYHVQGKKRIVHHDGYHFSFLYLNAAAVFILMVGFIVLLRKNRCKGKKCTLTSVISTTRSQVVSSADHHIASPCLVNERSEAESRKKISTLRSLELPKPPCGDDITNYSYNLDTETDYYSELKEQTSGVHIFSEQDICIITSMKRGLLYNRWMGSIAASKLSNKNVVLTTVSDATFQERSVHWNEFIKRVLELPFSGSLVKIEGICIDSAHNYLLYEYLICDTLRAKVTYMQPTGASKDPNMLTACKVKPVFLDIIQGMELLHSYGFLHPGLSTKKILITRNGVCKLYDFCLSYDASKIVALKKPQGMCSLNDFAPEALFRNEYTQKSDVWSLAVVLWEVLSGGVSPFSFNAPLKSIGATNEYNPQSRPGKYPHLRNNMIECWKQDQSSRPNTYQLKLAFFEAFESNEIFDCYETFANISSDVYVPMEGIRTYMAVTTTDHSEMVSSCL